MSDPRHVIVGAGVVGRALGEWLGSRPATRAAPVIYRDPPKRLYAAVRERDLVWICVPTPRPDEPQEVEQVLAELRHPHVVAIRSTLGPGCTNRLQQKFPKLGLLYVPEFLSEASALQDAMRPARSIVGVTEPEVGIGSSYGDGQRILAHLPEAPCTAVTSARIAECVKAFSNTFYALKVAFANQFYDFCVALGVPYSEVAELVKHDPMIASHHLDVWHKGYRGFGGKCLPKDSRAFANVAEDLGVEYSLLHRALLYNEYLRGKPPVRPEGSPDGADSDDGSEGHRHEP